MSRTYFSHKEDEAYRKGKHDQHHHKHNYEYDKYSGKNEDIAYFHGRDDETRDERRREEERMLEEEHERQERERQERMEYDRYLEEQNYYDDQMENSQLQNDEIDELSELDEHIISEKDLFHSIDENERDE